MATNSMAATRRTCATSGVWSREDPRGVARRRPQPGELVGGCGGAGARRSKARGGGRSSVKRDGALWCTGGRVGRCSVFLGTRRGRPRARTRRVGALAAATSWPAAMSSRARRSPRLEEGIGIGEGEVRCGGSQRDQRVRGRGRGCPVAPESTPRIHGGRRRSWRRRRLHGVLRLAWLDEEVEGVAADLGSVSGRRGGGGGYGDARQRRR